MAETAAIQPLLVERHWGQDEVIYGTRIETVPSEDSPALEVRPSNLVWSLERKMSAFAVCGSSVLAIVAGSRDTVVHDTATGTTAPGPQLRCVMRCPAMLPVGDDTVVVMDTLLRAGSCCFEALRRRRPGGGWRADPLPELPVEDLDDDDPEEDEDAGYSACVSSFFAETGTSRAWFSVSDRGTFSLDTERGAWRVEGTWELPLTGRAFFAPELGCVVGLGQPGYGLDCGHHWERCVQICALDIVVGAAAPPPPRHVWQLPAERAEAVPSGEMVSLAHLGNGRFCVSRSVTVELSTVRRVSMKGKGTSFAVVEVKRLPGGELQLAKRGKAHVHVWPVGHLGQAYFLQPA